MAVSRVHVKMAVVILAGKTKINKWRVKKTKRNEEGRMGRGKEGRGNN